MPTRKFRRTTIKPTRLPYLDYAKEGCWEGKTIGSLLADRVMDEPDGLALMEGGVSLTHRDLMQRVTALALDFRELGVGPGDVVLIQLQLVGGHRFHTCRRTTWSYSQPGRSHLSTIGAQVHCGAG